MRFLVLGCLLVTFATGCSSGVEDGTATSEAGHTAADRMVAGRMAPDGGEAEERLVVFTVNYPLAYFAERIGGDRVEVVFPAPAEVDPADWSPDAETVAAYQAADLVLLNGADYAKWVARVSLPPSRLIDTSAGFADRLIPLESTVTHTHGPTGEHSHAGWAFTIWLDPTLAGETAGAMRDAFTAVRPESGATFEAGFQALSADLERIDESLTAVVAQIGAPVVFSHPVYQYLIRRYGLEARSVHWEPHELPSEEDWEDLAVLLSGHRAETMIWESEPLAETRRRLEELGLEVLVYDPSPNRPAEGDWLSVMEANAGRLGSLSSSR